MVELTITHIHTEAITCNEGITSSCCLLFKGSQAKMVEDLLPWATIWNMYSLPTKKNNSLSKRTSDRGYEWSRLWCHLFTVTAPGYITYICACTRQSGQTKPVILLDLDSAKRNNAFLLLRMATYGLKYSDGFEKVSADILTILKNNNKNNKL